MTKRVVSYTLRNRTQLELEQLATRRRSELQIKLLALFMIVAIIARATA